MGKNMKLSGENITVANAINQEILKGESLYGNDNTNDRWACILGEEIGEVNHALNEICLHPENIENIIDNLKYELIQISAVSIRWLKELNKEPK